MNLPESQPFPEEPPVESMSANDLIDWIAYHANKQDRDWEYLRKELLRRVSQPSPSGDALALVRQFCPVTLYTSEADRLWQLDERVKVAADWLRSHDAKVRAALQESPSD